jgi:hypothetical protein
MIDRQLENGKPYDLQGWRSEDVARSYKEAQKRKDQQWLRVVQEQMRKVSNSDQTV